MAQESENNSDGLTELRYRNERIVAILQDEISRGDGAERKAIQLIAICGAGAAIVSAFVIAMLGGNAPRDGTTVVFVTALAVYLARSAIFSLMAIRPGKKFREDPIALMKERLTQDYAASLQADIDLSLWLYKEAVPVHSTKLFYLDRAVRNIAGAVIVALLATVLQMFIVFFTSTDAPAREFMGIVSTVIGIVTLLLAFTSDWLIERIGDTWTIPRSSSPDLSD